MCVWGGGAESLQSCLALCNPVDCNSPGFSVHGILQAIILQWVAIPFSRGSSQPRNWTCRQIFYSVSYPNVTRVQLWRPEIGIATILLANINSVFWFCQMSYQYLFFRSGSHPDFCTAFNCYVSLVSSCLEKSFSLFPNLNTFEGSWPIIL